MQFTVYSLHTHTCLHADTRLHSFQQKKLNSLNGGGGGSKQFIKLVFNADFHTGRWSPRICGDITLVYIY